MGYTSSIRKHERKAFTDAKKRIRNAIISHINTNESNHLKSSNIDDVKITTNSYFLTLKDGISSNKLITFPKTIDPESSVCINERISVSNYINEDNSSHQSSSELNNYACYDSAINTDNTEGEVDITLIDLKNETKIISMNDNINIIYKYYAPFLS